MDVVVGAGFAGLAAAVRLVAAGRQVLVLEARPRLGGRATALIDRETGAPVDNGQHVLFGCYRETLAFLDEIGAGGNVFRQPSLHVPYVDDAGRWTHLRCPDLPPPLHLAGGLLTWDAIGWRDRWSAVRVWRELRRDRASKGEARGRGVASERPGSACRGDLTVREWLVRLGQTDRLRELLWEPLAVAALNEPATEASAEAFAEVLRLMFSGPSSNAAIVMPAVPLDRMYALPARAFVEAGGGLVRENALAKVIVRSGRVRGVRVGPDTIAADVVISAVAWNSLATLFDGAVPGPLSEIAASAAALRSRPIVTVNLWYDRRVMDEPFVGMPGGTIQWVFEKGDAEASQLSLTVSGAVELVDRGNDEILRVAISDVEARLPLARRARLIRGTVVRERHATFGTVHPGVKRPGAVTPVEGLFLAGDWTDTGLPGTIEGAVRSGNRAAACVLQQALETTNPPG